MVVPAYYDSAPMVHSALSHAYPFQPQNCYNATPEDDPTGPRPLTISPALAGTDRPKHIEMGRKMSEEPRLCRMPQRVNLVC
jgi:hypothetical protein